MTDTPLTDDARELCRLIETLPAGLLQTDISGKANELAHDVEFEEMRCVAAHEDWKLPAVDTIYSIFDKMAWNSYWQQMIGHDREVAAGNSDPGRPVVPHRTGRGGVLTGDLRVPMIETYITLNGEGKHIKVPINHQKLSYEQIVHLAGYPGLSVTSVVWRIPGELPSNLEGTLRPGQHVDVIAGMKIDACDTSGA